MNLHKVFVYGTLKKSQPNCDKLSSSSVGHKIFKGDAITVKPYPLVIATKYNVPFLLDKPGTGKQVLGEIYEVDDAVLERLDDLEQHPHVYTRLPVEVCLVNGSNSASSNCLENKITCESYFVQNFKNELLDLPFLDRYDNSAASANSKSYIGAAYRKDGGPLSAEMIKNV